MSTRLPGSLPAGKERLVLDESPTTTGSKETELGLDADSVVVSLFISAISGDFDLKVETVGEPGQAATIIEFPTQSAVTSELIIRKAPYSLDRIKITATYTDAVTYQVRVRGAKVDEQKIVENSTDSFVMLASAATPWIDVTNLNTGAFSVSWEGIDATDGTMIMEGSNTDEFPSESEGEFGGNVGGITIDSLADDTQIFAFTSFPTKYIRLFYTHNTVSTGDATWNFEGKN